MDAAVYQFYERLRQNPDDGEALLHLWEYHGGRAEFQQLATLVEQTAGRKTDASSAADLYFRAGELWAKNVGRADRAVANYQRAFDKDPSQLAAVEAARAIYLQLGNARSAAQLLDRQLAATPDPLVRGMLLREGAKIRGQLNDADGQIAYLEEVLQGAPDDWEVLRELAAAYLARSQTGAAQEGDALRAAGLLSNLAQLVGGEHGLAFAEAALDAWPGDEPAYAMIHEAYPAAGRDDELTMRQIAFVQANPTSPYTPVISRSLAERYAAVGQYDDAVACLAPLVLPDPTADLEAARWLAALYRDAGRAVELKALLDVIDAGASPAERARGLKDVAAVYGQHGDRASMLATMRGVLAADPADPEALAVVEDDLRQRGAWAELREVMAEAVRAEHCPPEVRIPRLRDIALVSIEQLNEPEAALHAWREVIDSTGDDPEALAGLDQVLTAQERWEELGPVLHQRADGMPDGAERADVLRRLADLHRDRTGDRATESNALAQLWRWAPDDEAVSQRLVALRREVGNLAGVVEVLQRRAEGASGSDAAARQAELAVAKEAAGDFNGAVDAWRAVLSLDPSHPRAWDEVDRVLGLAGRHDERYATLLQRAEALPPGAERAALHARASDAARAMGDARAALDEAERAVEMNPADASLVEALMDSLEAMGERDRLLAFVRARSEGLSDGAEKVGLLRRAARVVGQTDPAGGGAVWQELRDCAERAGLGDDPEALEALLGLAELQGDDERVASLLAEAATAAQTDEEKRALLVRRARTLSDALGRPEEGLEAMHAAVKEHGPEHLPSWALVEETATALGRWQVAAEALERQARLTEDDDERSALAGRLVALLEEKNAGSDAVLKALELHHEVDPGDFGVIQRLADLYQSEGRWAEALRYLGELAEIEGDDEELSKITQHMAHVADEKLGDPRKAWELLLPLVQGGDIACLDALQELATRRGMDAELVPVLSDLAARVTDPESKAMLFNEIARRQGDRMSDVSGAFEAALQAVLAYPSRPEGLARLDALAARAGRPADVAHAYRAAVEAAGDPTTAHELAVQGLSTLESTGGAADALELGLWFLGRMPADDDVLDAALRVAPGLGRDNDVYVALDRRRKAAQTDPERFTVTLRGASVAGRAFGDAETAAQYLQQAVALATGKGHGDEALLERVEDVAADIDAAHPESGSLSGVVERYASLADDAAVDEPQVAAMLLRRAGEVCDRQLALADHATGLFARSVALWPADARAADRYEAVAGRGRRWAEVVALYQKVADDAYDAGVTKAYTARRATLLAERLGRVDEAIDAWRRLAEIAPKDVEVLHALQALCESHERWPTLLMAIEREVELGGDRVAGLKRMAAVWETKLKNPFEAREHWRRALRHAPDDAEALAAVARLDQSRRVVDDDDLEELLGDAPSPEPSPAPEPAARLDALVEPEPVGYAAEPASAEAALVEAAPEVSAEVEPEEIAVEPSMLDALEPHEDPRAALFGEPVDLDHDPRAAAAPQLEPTRPPPPPPPAMTPAERPALFAPSSSARPDGHDPRASFFDDEEPLDDAAAGMFEPQPMAAAPVDALDDLGDLEPIDDLEPIEEAEMLDPMDDGPAPDAAEALDDLEAHDVAHEHAGEEPLSLDDLEAFEPAPSLDDLASLTQSPRAGVGSAPPAPPPLPRKG